ncbi:MAG: hypothetical protein UT34_C0002G0098 [candidate division WS6 bacterium GW2011_GWF2_39_15]|uniref:DUF1616 domain-containing protein n=1 Tax=candidate division WS6 bacterium GW2011_GWF2_39_15 TaxID=1619100 RepID=A0A0G0MYJ7_9BACT|nr:MAG: hypothetical protein UT34_C0002G0098 [candidate division WS6 bacterium GW2011_GWF2_39_15]
MVKREIKRFRNSIEKYLDPFAIVAMILVLIIPALAVLNLSPVSKEGVKTNKNVLGESDSSELGFAMVGGVHDYIKEENLDYPEDSLYTYEATIIKHNKGRYSKPILQIENSGSVEQTLLVSGTLETPNNMEVSLILDDKSYRLVSREGEPFTISIKVPSQSQEIAYLQLVSNTDSLFNNHVNIQFTQK